jgi:hypothetical protein
MKLAAVNPIIDSNLDSILATEVSILVSLLLKKKKKGIYLVGFGLRGNLNYMYLCLAWL